MRILRIVFILARFLTWKISDMKTYFTEKDIAQIEAQGQTVEHVATQLEDFRRGFKYLNIDRAATKGDGIYVADKESIARFSETYRDAAPSQRIVKFVPASGAATRMFKELFEFVQTGVPNPASEKTVREIEKFAFYDLLKITGGADARATVRAVLDYGAHLPKGLIAFHKYPAEVRTAVEEHLTEGAMYAACRDRVNIHFTVSKEHEQGFRSLLAHVAPKYEARFGVKYDITFSYQDPATDTIAVTPDYEPFREADGSLLFRPAGHGALIGNLGRLDADIIFIKNIDNVTTDRFKADTVVYKILIGGMLLSLQKKIFDHLHALDRNGAITDIEKFITSELSYCFAPAYFSLSHNEKAAVLRSILDRPLRVCAMVRNEGEPGGGPFWVTNADGSKSLQIAESTQVAPDKKHLFREGTHFNPVDLVCAIKNYRGERFDLLKYTDPSTGFISEKSQNGQPLKARELPGLWNGAMANWNTVFIEAPISTFTPVKEVIDLLKPQHQ